MMVFICIYMYISWHGEDTCKPEAEVLSAGVAAGIAVTVTLLLALVSGCGYWSGCGMVW